jgi:hypothetical protein
MLRLYPLNLLRIMPAKGEASFIFGEFYRSSTPGFLHKTICK